MSNKISIKIGFIEFEYEGENVYTNEEIKDLFTHFGSFASIPIAKGGPITAFANVAPSSSSENSVVESNFENLAPNTVAARLDVKTGSDLAIASAAYIQLCLGRPSFNRRELLDVMQKSTNYFSRNIGSNLTASLKTLVSSRRINALSNDQMSLSASEQNNLRGKIDQ